MRRPSNDWLSITAKENHALWVFLVQQLLRRSIPDDKSSPMMLNTSPTFGSSTAWHLKVSDSASPNKCSSWQISSTSHQAFSDACHQYPRRQFLDRVFPVSNFSLAWSFLLHQVHVHLLADRVAIDFGADNPYTRLYPVLASRKRWDSERRDVGKRQSESFL